MGDACGILAILGQAVNHRAADCLTCVDEILRFATVGQRIGGRSCCDARYCLIDFYSHTCYCGIVCVLVALNVIPNRVIACICALGDACGILAILGQAVKHRAKVCRACAHKLLCFAVIGERVCCGSSYFGCCLRDREIKAYAYFAYCESSFVCAYVDDLVLIVGNGVVCINRTVYNCFLFVVVINRIHGSFERDGLVMTTALIARLGDGVCIIVCGVGVVVVKKIAVAVSADRTYFLRRTGCGAALVVAFHDVSGKTVIVESFCERFHGFGCRFAVDYIVAIIVYAISEREQTVCRELHLFRKIIRRNRIRGERFDLAVVVAYFDKVGHAEIYCCFFNGVSNRFVHNRRTLGDVYFSLALGYKVYILSNKGIGLVIAIYLSCRTVFEGVDNELLHIGVIGLCVGVDQVFLNAVTRKHCLFMPHRATTHENRYIHEIAEALGTYAFKGVDIHFIFSGMLLALGKIR